MATDGSRLFQLSATLRNPSLWLLTHPVTFAEARAAAPAAAGGGGEGAVTAVAGAKDTRLLVGPNSLSPSSGVPATEPLFDDDRRNLYPNKDTRVQNIRFCKEAKCRKVTK